MKFKLNFTDNLSIVYTLENSLIAKAWAKLIVSRNINECCKINHFMGWKPIVETQEKINRLYYLADYINNFAPQKVIKKEINKDTWRNALQVMHVHFPEMKNDDIYKDVWDELTEYNDIVHWLESIFVNNSNTSDLLRLTLDFNKTIFEFYDIPDSEFKYFTPFSEFGSLFLHYTHVGRHAYEMFFVNDFESPKEQFVPQRTFNASVRMTFYNYDYSTENAKQELNNRWTKFYLDKGGIDYWDLDINDPKIAFGFCKIGNISEILIDSTPIAIPKTIQELNDFRNKLIKTNVINWEIKGA